MWRQLAADMEFRFNAGIKEIKKHTYLFIRSL